MEAISKGIAQIKHNKTNKVFEIDSEELHWEVVGGEERGMGPEQHYRATVQHDELGVLSWNLWEYPVGIENYNQTSLNGHVLIEDLDYFLQHEKPYAYYEGEIDEIVEWFFQNYEDPAKNTPHDSREEGYQYLYGGPYDARDVVRGEFPEIYEDLLNASVKKIESQGNFDWAKIPLEETNSFFAEHGQEVEEIKNWFHQNYIQYDLIEYDIIDASIEIVEDKVSFWKAVRNEFPDETADIISAVYEILDAEIESEVAFKWAKIPPQIEDSTNHGKLKTQQMINWFHKNYIPYDSNDKIAKNNTTRIIIESHSIHKILKDKFPTPYKASWATATHFILSGGTIQWTPNDKNDRIEAPLQIPKQNAGPSFEVLENGKVSLRKSGLIQENDKTENLELLEVLKNNTEELLDDLKGSNAHSSLFDIIKRYQEVIVNENLSIDLMYAFGAKLENTNKRLKHDILNDGYPDLPPKAGGVLDSVLSIHGIIIASTQRGKELLKRLKDYSSQNLEIDKIKNEAIKLSEQISNSSNLATKEASGLIEGLNHDIGEGENPNRSTQIALTTNDNFLITLAKNVIKIAQGVTTIERAIIIFGGAITSIDPILAFVLDNISLLQDYAAVTGTETSWLINFLNWVKSKLPK